MSGKDHEREIDSIFVPLPRKSIAPAANGRAVLHQAMLEARVTDIGSILFLQWDLVRDLFERIAWMLTNDLPHPSGQPLLQVILVQSMNAFRLHLEDALKDPEGAYLPVDREVLEAAYVAMLHQAFTLLPSALEIEVRGPKGELWDPLKDHPLGKWAAERHGAVTMSLAQELPAAYEWIHPSQLRYAFLHQLISNHEIKKFMKWLPDIMGSGKHLN